MTTTEQHHHSALHHEAPEVVHHRQRLGIWIFIAGDVVSMCALLFTYLYLRGTNTGGHWMSIEGVPARGRTMEQIQAFLEEGGSMVINNESPLSRGLAWSIAAVVVASTKLQTAELGDKRFAAHVAFYPGLHQAPPVHDLSGAPILIPGRHVINIAVAAAMIFFIYGLVVSQSQIDFWLVTGLALLLGILIIIPIGGADMPVVISMLNSYSGWAAAGIGFTLGNSALIITGALVGSSGAILSYIMCAGMNRSFISVILGGFGGEVAAGAGGKSLALAAAIALFVRETPQGTPRHEMPDWRSALIGVAAVVLNKSVIGKQSLVGAGAVVTRDEALHLRLKLTHMRLGLGVGLNDVELLLRGLPSMALRYAAHDASTRQVATWLQTRPEIAQVLHPALPGSPGHAHWQACCTGAAGLVSMVFDGVRFSSAQVDAFVDALRLFKIGYSWGGPLSLVMPYSLQGMRRFPSGRQEQRRPGKGPGAEQHERGEPQPAEGERALAAAAEAERLRGRLQVAVVLVEAHGQASILVPIRSPETSRCTVCGWVPFAMKAAQPLLRRQGALHRCVVELAQQAQRIGQRKRGRHGAALCPSH